MTQPNAQQLLDIARLTLQEQILPSLPKELRYAALMIANAMAIAERQCRLQSETDYQEQVMLAVLVNEPSTISSARRRQLAQSIRQGRHDAPKASRTLVETLRQIALARMAINNPKAMP